MTDTYGVPVGTGQDAQLAAAEDERWNRDYGKWRRNRLQLVQASARVWLGLLTTLLGLLGSVVLFKGGTLVTGVTTDVLWQVPLIVLVGLVFAAAVLAVIAGGVATWGGLEDIVPSEEIAPMSVRVSATQRNEEVKKRSMPLRKALLRVVLWFAGTRKDDRDEALLSFEPKDESAEPAWQKYKGDIVGNADRNRIFLHASRILGVAAAALIGLLAIVAVIAGTVAPAPSEVVVVYHGRFKCVPVSDYTKYTGVTQVVSVNSC